MHRLSLAALVCVLLFRSAVASAQESERGPGSAAGGSADYLFPGRGNLSASLATGVPFLGIGELAYGIGDGFALGAMAAATPDIGSVQGTTAFGLRPRGVVYRRGPWRSEVVVPVLYYPSIDGFGATRDPWVLARPEVALERLLASGARVNLGLGIIAAACTESLVTFGERHSATVMGGVWESVRLGAAVPLSGRASLFGEASLVLRGALPARDWIGVAPAVAVLGVSWRL